MSSMKNIVEESNIDVNEHIRMTGEEFLNFNSYVKEFYSLQEKEQKKDKLAETTLSLLKIYRNLLKMQFASLIHRTSLDYEEEKKAFCTFILNSIFSEYKLVLSVEELVNVYVFNEKEPTIEEIKQYIIKKASKEGCGCSKGDKE